MLKHQVDRSWKDCFYKHTHTRTSAINRRAFPKARSQFGSLESLSQSCRDRLSEVHIAFLGRR